jgi:hypothetical protein
MQLLTPVGLAAALSKDHSARLTAGTATVADGDAVYVCAEYVAELDTNVDEAEPEGVCVGESVPVGDALLVADRVLVVVRKVTVALGEPGVPVAVALAERERAVEDADTEAGAVAEREPDDVGAGERVAAAVVDARGENEADAEKADAEELGELDGEPDGVVEPALALADEDGEADPEAVSVKADALAETVLGVALGEPDGVLVAE